jgi:hypothetical protein
MILEPGRGRRRLTWGDVLMRLFVALLVGITAYALVLGVMVLLP